MIIIYISVAVHGAWKLGVKDRPTDQRYLTKLSLFVGGAVVSQLLQVSFRRPFSSQILETIRTKQSLHSDLGVTVPTIRFCMI